MIQPCVFKLRPDAIFIPALPAIKDRVGVTSKALRFLPCTVLVLECACFGIGVAYLLVGTPDLTHSSINSSIALCYVAIFGCILISVLTMVRATLAAVANRSNVELVRDAPSVQARGTYHHSILVWAAFGTDVKTWLEASR